jgi:hypothetical protein
MTVHQCPKCELRFNWKTELDDHCWHDHPQFRHEYPAVAQPDAAAHPVAAAGAVDQVPVAPGKGQHRLHASSLIEWLVPGKPAESQHHDGA